MKTLHLPLKAKWYEMIESGVKTEEYRIQSDYWFKRLTHFLDDDFDITKGDLVGIKHFDLVKFSYGYTRRTMTYEIESITIGKGKREWGAPEENVFIIKLGKRLDNPELLTEK